MAQGYLLATQAASHTRRVPHTIPVLDCVASVGWVAHISPPLAHVVSPSEFPFWKREVTFVSSPSRFFVAPF